MSDSIRILIPDVHIPKWASPVKARECLDGYVDTLRAKWGEIAGLVVSYIGLYTVKEIYDKVRDVHPSLKLKDVIDILVDLHEKGYVVFEER